jgi:hypothetical protein
MQALRHFFRTKKQGKEFHCCPKTGEKVLHFCKVGNKRAFCGIVAPEHCSVPEYYCKNRTGREHHPSRALIGIFIVKPEDCLQVFTFNQVAAIAG